jgi:hypothetical protein
MADTDEKTVYPVEVVKRRQRFYLTGLRTTETDFPRWTDGFSLDEAAGEWWTGKRGLADSVAGKIIAVREMAGTKASSVEEE